MQWYPAPDQPVPARLALLPRLRFPVPPNALLLVMHEQVVGEVGVIPVEPQVVQLRRRICWLTNQALQRNGLYPHVNRFSTARSPSAHRYSRSRQGQQTVADGQPTNAQR